MSLQRINPEFRDRMIKSIEKQLEFLREWSMQGYNPSEPRLNDLNFGLLASKTIADFDVTLEGDLVELANFVDGFVAGTVQGIE